MATRKCANCDNPATMELACSHAYCASCHRVKKANECLVHHLHLDAYCEKCEKAVCAECLRKCEHPYTTKREYLNFLQEKGKEIKDNLEMLERLTEQCNRRTQMICSEEEAVCEQIRQYTTQFQEAIDAEREIMLDAARAMMKQKRTYLQEHAETAKGMKETLKRTSRNCGRVDWNNEGVKFYKDLRDKVKITMEKAQNLCQSFPLQSQMEVVFRESFADAIMEQMKSKLGMSVCLSMPASPEDIRIMGAGSRSGVVNIQARFEVTALHDFSHLPTVITDEVSCALVPQEPRGQADRIKCVCKKMGEDKFKVSYTAEQPGIYTWEFQLGGSKIPQSSPKILTILPSFENQRKAVSVECLDGPNGVAVNKEGVMVIAETRAHRITVKVFGKKRFGKQGFDYPSGVAFTHNSTQFLVTDTGNNRIKKMTLKGQVVAVVGGRGQKQLEFDTPTAIAVDHNGRALVVEAGNRRIQVLTPDLCFQRFIKFPFMDCDFTSVSADTEGYIFATCKTHCIHKFDLNGEYLESEFDEDRNMTPSCLCVSHLDLIYVGAKDRVLVFTLDGEFLHEFHDFGNFIQPAEFGEPQGVAVDSSSNLYISDKVNGRLIVLKY